MFATRSYSNFPIESFLIRSAMEAETASPTVRLFNALLVTMLAILTGLFCVRLRLIRPDEGDLKGMGFFIGSIAFPLLIFNTVATANIGAIDFGVIAACSLGKIAVMSLTWLLAFVAYLPHRSVGQRILTAAVFAFFAVASDDFAIGFPVIDALYGDEVDMSIYITGNALVGSFLFVPITIIAFAIGGALRGNNGEASGCRAIGRTIIYDLVTNPVLVMTCVGLILKIIFAASSTGSLSAKKLPSPFSNFIDLFTAPFGMSALFLTGTSLRSPRVAVWAVGLVLMKVVVCAYLSYAFGTLLLGTSGSTKLFRDFTFFYGAIPTGSPPIVFAAQFDPDSAELIATSVLFGLMLAGPIMFVTANSLGLHGDAAEATKILQQVQASVDASSIFCGGAFFLCLLLLRWAWHFKCPAKLLLAVYGMVLLVYAVVSLMLNPLFYPQSCELFKRMELRTPLVLTFSWLQNTASIMLLLLQSMLVCGPAVSKERPVLGVSIAGACFVFALLPSLLATPNTINEICGVSAVRNVSLSLTFAWSCLQLLIASVLAINGLCKARQRANRAEWRSERSESSEEARESDSSYDGSADLWQQLVPQGPEDRKFWKEPLKTNLCIQKWMPMWKWYHQSC